MLTSDKENLFDRIAHRSLGRRTAALFLFARVRVTRRGVGSSGYLTAVLREIRRLGFSQVDSVFLKNKWHIHNALDAKITSGLVHNGERGFHMHSAWLYSSTISQSYRGFTGFCGICSGIPRLNTARGLEHLGPSGYCVSAY